MEIKDVLPRRSVLKAIVGALFILAPLVLLALGHDSMGVFGLVPIVVGGFLIREYFTELRQYS